MFVSALPLCLHTTLAASKRTLKFSNARLCKYVYQMYHARPDQKLHNSQAKIDPLHAISQAPNMTLRWDFRRLNKIGKNPSLVSTRENLEADCKQVLCPFYFCLFSISIRLWWEKYSVLISGEMFTSDLRHFCSDECHCERPLSGKRRRGQGTTKWAWSSFYHSMNHSANILLRRGGIWYMVFETKTTTQTNSRKTLHVLHFWNCNTQAFQVWWWIPGHHRHPSCPLLPPGTLFDTFMSHIQKTWLVFQSRMCQCFGIIIIIINVTKTGDGEGANDQAEPMRIRENLKKLVRDF